MRAGTGYTRVFVPERLAYAAESHKTAQPVVMLPRIHRFPTCFIGSMKRTPPLFSKGKVMRKNKVVTAEEAIAHIEDNAFVAIQGSGGGVSEPTHLLRAIRERFLATGHPKNITLYHTSGLGDKAGGGTDLLALEGLVKRVICGHWAMAPEMARLALDEKIEAYNLPQGVISQMFSAIAAKRPGVITKIGLNTFVDPRLEGGRMNRSATEQMVEVVQLAGEEWLFYPAPHLDVVLLRGTTADTEGNITTEQEAAVLEGISIAQAGRNCGALTIAQAKYLTERGTLKAQDIRIPGILVDTLVIHPEQWQTAEGEFVPAMSGSLRIPFGNIPPIPLDERKVIARRAVKELAPGAIMNLGVGMPSGVAAVATEIGLIDDVTFCLEQGIIGGMPAGGVIFGASYNPTAIINAMNQFDFFDGGGLDITFLGMAEADQFGNVNSSKTGKLLSGCGGFINISQNAKKVVFCSTFTAKGFKARVGGGRLTIEQDGQIVKFVDQVEQITFSGKNARVVAQKVMIVTERAVFELREQGLTLTEIAPGVELEKDILGRMTFRPIVADDLREMDAAIFA